MYGNLTRDSISRHPLPTLGTRGFSRVRREFSVFGRRPKPRAAKPREKAFRAGHYKDLTETGNRARNVSGTQGTLFQTLFTYRQTTHAQSNLVSPQFNQSKTYWIPGCGFRFPLQWILDGPISFSTVDIGFLSLAGLRIPVSTGMISRIDSGTKICLHGATCTWFSLVMWWYRGLLN